MAQWFYLDNGVEEGPFDSKAFRSLVDRGVIGSDTQVRNDSSTNWVVAGEVTGLIRRKTTAAAPAPASAPAEVDEDDGESNNPPTRGPRSRRAAGGTSKTRRSRGDANPFATPQSRGRASDADDGEAGAMAMLKPLAKVTFFLGFIGWFGMIIYALAGVFYPIGLIFELDHMGAIMVIPILIIVALCALGFYVSFKCRIAGRDIKKSFNSGSVKTGIQGVRSLATVIRVIGILAIVYLCVLVLFILAAVVMAVM